MAVYDGAIKVSGGVGASLSKSGTGSIPITGWVSNAGEYPYKYNLTVEGIILSDVVITIPDIDNLDTVGQCGLSPTVDTFNGGITFYAKSIPNQIIGFTFASVVTQSAPTSFAQLQFGSVQQNLTGAWAKFTRFTDYISRGNDFTGDVTAQSITCNFTGFVEVSAKLYLNGLTVGDLAYIGIVNGANLKAFNILKMATTGDVYNMIVPLILPVTNGDVLAVHIMNLTAARGACGSSGSAVAADYFSVRRI